eukprot:11909650-Karenia_brevis.AAC.1
MMCVCGDQCMFGQISISDEGDTLPAQKATGCMTNSPCVAAQASVLCDKKRIHQQLISGRAKAAERYPRKL